MEKDNKIENGEAIAIYRELQRLKHRVEKLNKEIRDKTEEMHVACIHNDTEVKDSYIEGGYLDRSQYIKTLVCKLCGKELDKVITTGGYC